jgi:hypothetical protein
LDLATCEPASIGSKTLAATVSPGLSLGAILHDVETVIAAIHEITKINIFFITVCKYNQKI